MPRRHPAFWIMAPLLSLGLTIGCEVRDEQPGSSAGGWASTITQRFAAKPPGCEAGSAATDRLECVEGFAAGSRRAADSGLPLVLIFRASWCRWSDGFLAAMIANTELIGSADRFVCATVDADREPAICRSFGVRAFPTAIALDPLRRERFRATGAAAREQLATVINGLVAEPNPRLANAPEPARR